MGGILKNKPDTDLSPVAQSTKEFREQVLKNTKLNALLKDFKPEFFNEKGEVDMAKLESLTDADREKLKWNQKNLSDNAEIQQKIIENMETSIDEPKTPFQHAEELNEYYLSDEEDELNGFSLGEPEIKVDELDDKFERPVHPEEVNNIADDDDDEEEDSEETQAPKKKMSFDELRKMHYHHEVPKFHPVDEEQDDDEDDDEEEQDTSKKPKMSFAEMRKMPAATTQEDDGDDE